MVIDRESPRGAHPPESQRQRPRCPDESPPLENDRRSRPSCSATTVRCCSSAASKKRPPRCTSAPRSAATATSTWAKRPPASGLTAGMQPNDYLFTNYREHGYALARGIEPDRVMAELFGREDRRLAWPRRLDAPVRPRKAPAGRLRDRRRPTAAWQLAPAWPSAAKASTTWSSARWATAPPTSAPSTNR